MLIKLIVLTNFLESFLPFDFSLHLFSKLQHSGSTQSLTQPIITVQPPPPPPSPKVKGWLDLKQHQAFTFYHFLPLYRCVCVLYLIFIHQILRIVQSVPIHLSTVPIIRKFDHIIQLVFDNQTMQVRSHFCYLCALRHQIHNISNEEIGNGFYFVDTQSLWHCFALGYLHNEYVTHRQNLENERQRKMATDHRNVGIEIPIDVSSRVSDIKYQTSSAFKMIGNIICPMFRLLFDSSFVERILLLDAFFFFHWMKHSAIPQNSICLLANVQYSIL